MLDFGAIPRLGAGVLLESTPGQSYLYDSESHAYAMLDNEVAVEIMRLCDGTKSIGAICESLAILYDAPLERIQEDVLRMLETLAEESFIQS
jgi:hypothetical protein